MNLYHPEIESSIDYVHTNNFYIGHEKKSEIFEFKLVDINWVISVLIIVSLSQVRNQQCR